MAELLPICSQKWSKVFQIILFKIRLDKVGYNKVRKYLTYNRRILSLNIKLNGNSYVPTDSEGTKLSPIVYNGNSYLPVRSISQVLGIAVNYDEATSTIMLGEQEGKGTKLEGLRASGGSSVVASRDADILSIHGETINDGFYSLTFYQVQ
ncbi:stalk domain-containing protein [Paenibacillus sp. OAS669]|uniref:stalk domain-containing protein n=1 Tax=Paenibacillus sp. OAS669 TaxID=2663821 RepID=UPI0039A04293